jgi:hypothetical protein
MAALTAEALVIFAIVGCEMATDSPPRPAPERFTSETHTTGPLRVVVLRDGKTGKEYLAVDLRYHTGAPFLIESPPRKPE